ncbi:hypothetical protein AMJ80_06165 [bacterium SM23_31]|nr:MAG: hypothetical protein AMJ80_06165 [bacterium SM23_31]
MAEDVYLFAVEPKIQQNRRAWGNYNLYGNRYVTTPNEPNAVEIYYYLKNPVQEDITVTVSDPYGNVLRTMNGETTAGINKMLWNIGRISPGEYVVTLETGDKKWTQKTRVLVQPEK